MAWNQIEVNLQEIIDSVKDQWNWFIDDQIGVLEGRRNHFCGKVKNAYITDNDEAEKRLAIWQNRKREKIRS